MPDARTSLPDLLLPLQQDSTGRPVNLAPLLYRGGAKCRIYKVEEQIRAGELGPPMQSRIELVRRLRDYFLAFLARGRSASSARSILRTVRSFYSWVDAQGREASLTSIIEDYLAWSEALLHRARIKRDFKYQTAYGQASQVSCCLVKALGLSKPIVRQTRLRFRLPDQRVLGTQADRQNLEEVFTFGHFLLDLRTGLSTEAITGPVPVKIPIRPAGHLLEKCGFKHPRTAGEALSTVPGTAISPQAWAPADRVVPRHVRVLVNLRLAAEILIFISVTSMNLAEVNKLKRGPFRYQTDKDYIKVYRAYKRRRGGRVYFRIYSEYRELFVSYLSWIERFVPSDLDDRLFPFLSATPGTPPTPKEWFAALRLRSARIGIRFTGPAKLRKTKVNWLLRKTQNSALAAEMSQHLEETLFKHYQQPHHQVAAIQITRYHARNEAALAAPSPGLCASNSLQPIQKPGMHPTNPQPDCISASGCLACTHHRDVDAFDYFWSLASFGYLKKLELRICRTPSNRSDMVKPAHVVAKLVHQKLQEAAKSGGRRFQWVEEARARVREGRFHPAWDGFIQIAEVSL